jgi:adenosylcobinamide-GDP ribazoletransferase
VRALKGILAQFSFFTIIPSVKVEELEVVAEYSFTAPLVVGVIAGVVDFSAYFALWLAFKDIAKILLIAVVELIRGFNHLDGLLDVSDALMVKGDYERRLKALKDVEVGSGGIGGAILYFTLMLASVLLIPPPSLPSLFLLVSAEVSSRSIGLLVLATLKPMEGSFLGSLFHKHLSKRTGWLVVEAIPFLLPFLWVVYLPLYSLFYYLAKRELRGSSGDFTGFVITLSFPVLLMANEKFCSLFCSLHLFGI